MVKQWKTDGPEQDLLERMFEEGSIEDWETAVSVQARDPTFKVFSERVFSNHFRQTKTKMGYDVKNNSNSFHFCFPKQYLMSENSFQSAAVTNTPSQSWVVSCQQKFNADQPIRNRRRNQLARLCIATRHAGLGLTLRKKKDFVCVAIPAICGMNSKFVISEDGQQINVTYDWPEVMLNPNELFSKTINDGKKIAMSHPKIHSFMSHLHESGVTEKSSAQGGITITLPIKVQRENDSWSMEKVVISGTKMILLEFSAFQKELITNYANTSLDF